MTEDQIFENIKVAIEGAPKNQITLELHLQMIKYASALQNISSKDFCDRAGLRKSYRTEFSKMRNLVSRLKQAGLRVEVFNRLFSIQLS